MAMVWGGVCMAVLEEVRHVNGWSGYSELRIATHSKRFSTYLYPVETDRCDSVIGMACSLKHQCFHATHLTDILGIEFTATGHCSRL